MKTNNFAFPQYGNWEEQGLTKREWFAGMAMIGFLAAHADPECGFPSDDEIRLWSFKYADAMLAESQKTGGSS